MSTVTAPEGLLTLLSNLKERTEVRDSNGKLVGYFMPFSQDEAEKYERAKKLFDPEERRRRKETERGTGVTTEEMHKRVCSLESPT